MPAGLVHMHCIRQAVEMGYYVITCDNQPSNPGHALAHEHYIVSTVDREGVLKLARENHTKKNKGCATDFICVE